MKILIVDDEKNTRESLKEFIPWDELAIDEICLAKNGIDALLKSDSFAPNILLTDVRMPKMDGIALSKEILLRFPQCKIVFLSGYSDKEYLKSAIELSAINYIEKPVDITKIVSVLKNTVNIIKKQDRVNKYESLIKDNKQLVKNEIAQQLIRSNCLLSSIWQKLSDYSIPLDKNESYTPISIIFNWNYQTSYDIKEKTKYSFLNDLKDYDFSSYSVYDFLDKNTFVLISGIDIKDNGIPLSIVETLSKINENTFSFSIGIGECVNSIDKISISYQKARQASSMQFYLGNNRIIYSSKLTNNELDFDRSTYMDFRKALQTKDTVGLIQILNTFTHSSKRQLDININYVKNILFNLLMIVFDSEISNNIIDSFSIDEKNFIWKEIDRLTTIDDIVKYIKSNIESIFESTNKKQKANSRIDSIKNFIEENYSEKNLSIQYIADNVYLSQTYLCAYFKKATNKTLNQYITETRIMKAKALLKSNNYKLYEITEMVGFTDANYFTTLFKKHEGVTPSDYIKGLC